MHLQKPSYNNISFKYWPQIHWYKTIGIIDSLEQHEHALELIFLANKSFAYDANSCNN